MTNTIIPSLKVDPEFQALIPPLSDDEYQRLEASLVNSGWEGWRGPILVWDGVIVDGHNRYRICQEHGIAFTTKKMHFSGRDTAKLFIIDNQLKRRNLPPAAIGDLKLEEKEIVARQAKERMSPGTNQYSKRSTPNLGETKADRHSGETYEILARDIPMGRESLRKLDVIKQKAKEGDPVAISEREALISGKKKSIHGAYARVVGKEQRKQQRTEDRDDRRICTICGKPINEGEHYQDKLNWHYKCGLEHAMDIQRQYRDADQDLRNNVAIYTIQSFTTELTSSAESLSASWEESVSINESMGVRLTDEQKEILNRAVSNLFEAIKNVREGQQNG